MIVSPYKSYNFSCTYLGRVCFDDPEKHLEDIEIAGKLLSEVQVELLPTDTELGKCPASFSFGLVKSK